MSRNVLPEHVPTRALHSASETSGTSFSAILGGFTFAIGFVTPWPWPAE